MELDGRILQQSRLYKEGKYEGKEKEIKSFLSKTKVSSQAYYTQFSLNSTTFSFYLNSVDGEAVGEASIVGVGVGETVGFFDGLASGEGVRTISAFLPLPK